MAKRKLPPPFRRRNGIPFLSKKDFIESDFAEEGNEETTPSPDEPVLSPARRKELRKEMDEAIIHYFGKDADQIKNN